MYTFGYLTIYARKGFSFLETSKAWQLKYSSHTKKSITYKVQIDAPKYGSWFLNSLSIAREDYGLRAYFQKSK